MTLGPPRFLRHYGRGAFARDSNLRRSWAGIRNLVLGGVRGTSITICRAIHERSPLHATWTGSGLARGKPPRRWNGRLAGRGLKGCSAVARWAT